VRYFDAARSYGASEVFLAEWLASRGVRPAPSTLHHNPAPLTSESQTQKLVTILYTLEPRTSNPKPYTLDPEP
jgi:hypothetical protein